MNKDLQKNLKRYSAAAAAIIASGSAADAQIVYQQVNKTITPASMVDSVDFNSDGIYDVGMQVLSYSSYGLNIVSGGPINSQGHAMAGSAPSSYYYPFRLNAGAAINTQAFLPEDSFGSFMFVYGGTTPFGSFWKGGVVDGHLGLKLKFNGNTHFGWMRMDMNAAGTQVVIKDIAYNSTPMGAINAGQGLNLDTYADIANSVWATGKTIHSEVIAPYQNGKITVSDISGKVITAFDLNHTKEAFDASNLATGTYVLTIKLDEDSVSKKVILN